MTARIDQVAREYVEHKKTHEQLMQRVRVAVETALAEGKTEEELALMFETSRSSIRRWGGRSFTSPWDNKLGS